MNEVFKHEYVGAIHMHSSFSDGAKKISDIALSAASVGLDFIVITDHDFMTDSLHLDAEGYYNGLLVLLGLEIGVRHHHYLACDIREMVSSKSLSPQQVIDRVNDINGFGFLAHPFEKGMPFSDNSIAYTWNDLEVTGFTGIEIWNFSSRWKERIKTVFHGLFFLLFKSRSLKGPSKRTILFWDNACKQRRVVAVGGPDAHGAMFRWGFIRLRPLSYDFLLNTITTHILTDRRLSKDFIEARAQVYDAIKEGRMFIAHERLESARGFRFCFVYNDGTSVSMGEEALFKPGYFSVEAPRNCEIRLIKDGRLKEKRHGRDSLFFVEEKGVYRVEVFLRLSFFGLRPWIFTNPIYLR